MIIVWTPDTLGGSPRLSGRRLDVGHVILGITDFALQGYVNQFEVSLEQIKHALLYCRERKCLQDYPLRACNGCSLKFWNDKKSLRDFIYEFGTAIEMNEVSEELITIKDKSFLSEEVEALKVEFEGNQIWKQAEILYNQFKNELNLPQSYQDL